MSRWTIIGLIIMAISLVACDGIEITVSDGSSGSSNSGNSTACTGECGFVTNVVDGDTIDVIIDGTEYRVRYVGINTPERDEVCSNDATVANSSLVLGKTVRLEKDVSDTDRYGRLLRYIYVGDIFVNQILVADGYAEAVLYNPDDREFEEFRRFEVNAARNGLGCHPTGIFDDNNPER